MAASTSNNNHSRCHLIRPKNTSPSSGVHPADHFRGLPRFPPRPELPTLRAAESVLSASFLGRPLPLPLPDGIGSGVTVLAPLPPPLLVDRPRLPSISLGTSPHPSSSSDLTDFLRLFDRELVVEFAFLVTCSSVSSAAVKRFKNQNPYTYMGNYKTVHVKNGRCFSSQNTNLKCKPAQFQFNHFTDSH